MFLIKTITLNLKATWFWNQFLIDFEMAGYKIQFVLFKLGVIFKGLYSMLPMQDNLDIVLFEQINLKLVLMGS